MGRPERYLVIDHRFRRRWLLPAIVFFAVFFLGGSLLGFQQLTLVVSFIGLVLTGSAIWTVVGEARERSRWIARLEDDGDPWIRDRNQRVEVFYALEMCDAANGPVRRAFEAALRRRRDAFLDAVALAVDDLRRDASGYRRSLAAAPGIDDSPVPYLEGILHCYRADAAFGREVLKHLRGELSAEVWLEILTAGGEVYEGDEHAFLEALSAWRELPPTAPVKTHVAVGQALSAWARTVGESVDFLEADA